MILAYGHQPGVLGMATIIFYTCIWIPLHHTKEHIFRIIRLVTCYVIMQCEQQQSANVVALEEEEKEEAEPSLTSMMFEDVMGVDGDDCSICLMHYHGRDMVSQLPSCGHAFHARCIAEWLQQSFQNRRCPLCRSPPTPPSSCLLSI